MAKNVKIKLPVLHSGQIKLYKDRERFNVARAGRRFGKSIFLVWLASKTAIRGKQVGVFAPEHRQLAEIWDGLIDILDPIIKSSNKNEGTIKTINGGKIDFWTIIDNPLAGRGRSYDLVLVDEVAFTNSPQTKDEIWFKSIKPTMLTTQGKAWLFSTPNGVNPDNLFYAACKEAELGFKEHYAPSLANPYVPPEEIELERQRQHESVFQQEYLAEFIDWRSVSLLSIDKLLVDGAPVPFPDRVDTVYAVIDSAMKAGQAFDGTAVVYFSYNSMSEQPLTILDWQIVSIDAAMLEHWIPSVFERLEELAVQTKAIYGVTSTFIEGKGSGIVLLQQAQNRGWNVREIEPKFVQLGKDDRAFSISGYHFQEKIKISEHAYYKTLPFKGATRNHLLTEMADFRLGDPDINKKSNDLVDCYVYGVSLGCGDKLGF